MGRTLNAASGGSSLIDGSDLRTIIVSIMSSDSGRLMNAKTTVRRMAVKTITPKMNTKPKK